MGVETLSLRSTVFEIFEFKNVYLEIRVVTEGHWKWYHSIDWMWFPINFVPKKSKTRRFLGYSTCKYTMTLKSGLGATQGHRNRHVSIRHRWLPVNIPYQAMAYLVPFPRQTTISVEKSKILPRTSVYFAPRNEGGGGFRLELGTGAAGDQ